MMVMMMMLTKMIKMMMMISHPLPESHTAGCRSRGEDLCCLSRSVPAKPTLPPGLDFLEIGVCIFFILCLFFKPNTRNKLKILSRNTSYFSTPLHCLTLIPHPSVHIYALESTPPLKFLVVSAVTRSCYKSRVAEVVRGQGGSPL